MSNNNESNAADRIKLALLGYKAGIYEWNMLDDTAYYSPEWMQMLGYEDGELEPLLSTWKDRVHPDDLDAVMKNVQKAVDARMHNIETTHRLKNKDGDWIWILGRGLIQYDENGNAIRMNGIHTDITEQKTKELSYKQQSQIIDQIHDAVIVADLDGKITHWNKGATKLTGYSRSEAIGKNVTMLYINKDWPTLKNEIFFLLKRGEHDSEAQLQVKNQKIIDVEISFSVFKDKNNMPISIIGYGKDITKRKLVEKKLDYQAHYDTLTNLPNRLLFNDRLKQSIEIAKRKNAKLAIFFIDLDNFKNINDCLGHKMGDKVLIEVSKRMLACIRKEDTLSRFGGDEFTILMQGLNHEVENSSLLAKKLLKVLSEPIVIDTHTLHISASIGISFFPHNGHNDQELLKNSDDAMYKAKEAGKNNFQFYKEE